MLTKTITNDDDDDRRHDDDKNNENNQREIDSIISSVTYIMKCI